MTERKLSVIETSPFAIEFKRKYMMLTDEERMEAKKSNPELNIRLADPEEEVKQLGIHEDAMDLDDE